MYPDLLLAFAALLAVVQLVLLGKMLQLFGRMRRADAQAAPTAAPNTRAHVELQQAMSAVEAREQTFSRRLSEAEDALADVRKKADLRPENAQALASLRAELEAMQSEISALDLATLESEVAAVRLESGALLSKLGELESRLLVVEQRQQPTGPPPRAAIQQSTEPRSGVVQPDEAVWEVASGYNATDSAIIEGTEQPAVLPKRKGPTIISATGRARFREVMELWGQGNDAGTIARQTGIDLSEIELMLGGAAE